MVLCWVLDLSRTRYLVWGIVAVGEGKVVGWRRLSRRLGTCDVEPEGGQRGVLKIKVEADPLCSGKGR